MPAHSSTERLYKIESLIRQRGCVSFQVLMDTLEVSRATLKRDLEYLRSRLGAPIEYDRDNNGYRFGGPAGPGNASSGTPDGRRHELPGLWFNERELYSLLMAHQLLSGLDSDGPLTRHLQPLLERIHGMLASGDDTVAAEALMKRVKIVGALRRPVPGRHFERVTEALLQRRRLRLVYLSRSRGEVGERDVSPQRLVHYRNTWYLDAWCHRADGLRRFALDAIERAETLDHRARNVALREVQAAMDTGYGIFAGGTLQWAVLRFAASVAPWISREEWHPEQQGRALEHGGWELRLPFVDQTELVMDLLRQGEHVEVIEPASLRDAVRQRLTLAAGLYVDET
jgi:predicted DNA-binding transcriptional regulator YafY